MPTASGANVDLAYVKETTQGVTPSTPSMTELPSTSKNINPSKNILQSELRKSHRQIEDLRHGFQQVEGSIGIELEYGNFDVFLEAVMGGTFSTETAGTPEVLLVGSNVDTFTIERRFTDINQYQVFRGVAINQMSLNVQPESIVNAQLDIVGMGWDPISGTELGSPASVTAEDPFDSFTGQIQEGGSQIAIVTGLNFTINNGRNVQARLMDKESKAVYDGTAVITGTVTAYFEDSTLLDKFLNETESSIQVRLDKLDGADDLTFLFPRVKYTGGDMDPSQEGPVTIELPFQALYDQTETTSLKISRSNN